MRKQASLIFALGLAFPIVAGIVACQSSYSKSDSSAGTAPSAKVATAQRGDISHVLTLAGQFQPYQVVDVHPKVSGYMAHINVDIGDIVHQGQTLAVLEVPELKAELQGSAFQLQQTKEEITRAQHEVSRAEATHAALHAASERLKQAAAGTAWIDRTTGTGRRASQGSCLGGAGGLGQGRIGGGARAHRRSAL